MDEVIRVIDVWKSFGDEVVLKGVRRSFHKGDIHGIVGNNGSGKTVLMKCICGFLQPDRGEVMVGKKRIGKDTDFPKNAGVIIETPGFLPHLSGYQNLKILAQVRNKVNHDGILEVMGRVGLQNAVGKKVGKYSLGMRQRLGIAQAIMENPEILILDEPFNGLDKKGVEEMRLLLIGMREKGTTILLASHNPADIEMLCDTVCEMDAGHMRMVK